MMSHPKKTTNNKKHGSRVNNEHYETNESNETPRQFNSSSDKPNKDHSRRDYHQKKKLIQEYRREYAGGKPGEVDMFNENTTNDYTPPRHGKQPVNYSGEEMHDNYSSNSARYNNSASSSSRGKGPHRSDGYRGGYRQPTSGGGGPPLPPPSSSSSHHHHHPRHSERPNKLSYEDNSTMSRQQQQQQQQQYHEMTESSSRGGSSAGRGNKSNKTEFRQSHSKFKDFSDSRLFNPYGESHNLGTFPSRERNLSTTSNEAPHPNNNVSSSSSHNQNHHLSEDPTTTTSSSAAPPPPPPPSQTNSQTLAHHEHAGGIIHLPKDVHLYAQPTSNSINVDNSKGNPHSPNHHSKHSGPLASGFYPPQHQLPTHSGQPPMSLYGMPYAPPQQKHPTTSASNQQPNLSYHHPSPYPSYYPPTTMIPNHPPHPHHPPPPPPTNYSIRPSFFPPSVDYAPMQFNFHEIQTFEGKLNYLLNLPIIQPTLQIWWKDVQTIRTRLLAAYEEIILKELDHCNKTNLELLMWKNAFHNIYEFFRRLAAEPVAVLTKKIVLDPANESHSNGVNGATGGGGGGDIHEKLETLALEYLNNSHDYLLECLKKLSQMYSVDIESAMNCNYVPLAICLLPHQLRKRVSSRTRKLVYLTAQKLCIFLGDLARYKSTLTKSISFGPSRSWYLKAQVLEPKNGSPYNQLAVLANSTKRYLEVVYYYMRSLAASNPFSTAIQSLGSLFDDVRKAADSLIRQRQNSLRKRREAKQLAAERHQTRFGNESRLEIWTHPKGGSKETSLIEEEAEEREDYSNMAFVELTKRFTISFMHCHSKLFTKIGMESFPEVCSSMLQEFRGIINYNPLTFTGESLCHLFLINAFEILRCEQQQKLSATVCVSRNSRLENDISTSSNAAAATEHIGVMRSQLQEQVCRMGLDMFAILCERAVQHLKTFRNPPDLPLSNDLSALIQAIRLWSEWMILHPEHWNPPPANQDPSTMSNGPLADCWTVVASLCTVIAQWINDSNAPGNSLQRPTFYIEKPASLSTDSKSELAWKAFVLNEEAMTAGFAPMDQFSPQIIYYQCAANATAEDCVQLQTQISDYIRLDKLALFGDFLCGIEPPVLEFDLETLDYRSLIPLEQSERAQDILRVSDSAADQLNYTQGTEQVKGLLQEIAAEEKAAATTTTTAISDEIVPADVKILGLQRRRNDLLRERQLLENAEAKRKSAIQAAISRRCLELLVFPVYLVPDTNCYIDHLPGIQALCRSPYFTIILPIIVLNELDFLAQSQPISQLAHQLNYINIKMPKDRSGNSSSTTIVSHTDRFNEDNLEAPHGPMLKQRAQAAIKWLEEEFETGNKRLRAMTSEGETLQTIQFRTEAFERQGRKNDDIILDCCHRFVKDMAKDFKDAIKNKDQPVRLHREVVLLTGDRNLRLKALSANIPVRPLKPFLNWAKVKP